MADIFSRRNDAAAREDHSVIRRYLELVRHSFFRWTFRAVVIGLSFYPAQALLSALRWQHDASLIKHYDVISVADASSAGSGHKVVYITSGAGSLEERAYTVRWAALQLHRATPASAISVFLFPSKAFAERGMALAIADYTPSEGGSKTEGVWRIEASEGTLEPNAIAIVGAWCQTASLLNDEEAATSFVALKLGIDADAVRHDVAWVSKIVMNRRPYPLSGFAE